MSQITLEYVEQLSDQLSIEDQLALSEYLQARLQNVLAPADSPRKPQDLYGLWEGAFPEELDIDATLQSIRHEWEKELEEFGA